MEVREKLKKLIADAAGVSIEQVKLEHPEVEEHGDYSTNIALIIKKPAKEIAEKIKDEIIEKVEVAGPGFINIRLKNEYLGSLIGRVIEVQRSRDTKKIMFEYGQPNTHKLPHIGHLFSYIYGEAMCRILEAVGNGVRRVNYQGDVGLHVAKCLWAYLKDEPKVPADLEGKVKMMQVMYQQGSQAYDNDESAKKEIGVLNKKIYAGDAIIKSVWEETRGWSVEYYKQFEGRIGSRYDQYYFESQVAQEGKDVVEKNVGQVFEKSEGAIVYKGSHTRVFVTKEGNPTYEAKDLALELRKMKDWPCDLLVITTAAEQNEYFKVVFAALGELDKSLVGKLKHVGFGMINLKSGKMASRTGNIIGGVELVDMIVNEVKTEAVGLGAVKYAFLKKSATQDMDFDVQGSIATEGNSGPYLQYTYARCQSVLRKSERAGEYKSVSEYEFNEEELRVLRWIYRFPEVVEEAAVRYAPNLICNFLFELAQRYNSFYNKCSILNAKDLKEKEFRLAMTEAVGQVLKNGLNLLGIEVLERM